jgi:hypothetical protein
MLAMVLAVSIPAVADVDLDDVEDVVEDEFFAADDVDCFVADEDGDGLFEEDAVDGLDNDFDGLTDEEIVCVVEFEGNVFADFDEFDSDDFDEFCEDFDGDFFCDEDEDDDDENDDDGDDNERERISVIE